MIRPVTCVCLLMAAGSGLYLYQAKHQAQLLDREITRTMTEVDRLRQRINVLRADYQLEQDPETLGELTQQYLEDLKPTAPGQFTTWAELEKRLPPIPPPPPPEATPSAPAPVAPPVAATPEDTPVARAEPPHPAVAPEPARVETARTERPAATRPAVPPVAAIAMAPLAPPASRQGGRGLPGITHQTLAPVLASAGAGAARVPPPVSLAPVSFAPGSFAPGSFTTRAAAVRPPAPVFVAARPNPTVPALAYAPKSYAQTAPAAPPMPMVASALGMARVMFAPVAVSPANAATTYPTRYPNGNMPNGNMQ